MKYIKVLNDLNTVYPYSDRQLRQDYPLTSFPALISDEIRSHYKVFPVVEEQKPQYDKRTQDLQRLPPRLVEAVWTVQYVIIDKTQEQIAQYDEQYSLNMVKKIKAEANRRIVQIVPEWKQLNLLARSTELVKIGEQNWTEAEREEVVLIESIWNKVKHIRAKSDELEVMSPIPDDYQDDKYWT